MQINDGGKTVLKQKGEWKFKRYLLCVYSIESFVNVKKLFVFKFLNKKIFVLVRGKKYSYSKGRRK